MEEPITHPDQITPAWITQVLTANGALIQGQVEKVEFDVNERELSTNVRLKVKYSGESLGRKPDRLFLNMVKADMKDEFFGPSEVNYYIRDYTGLKDAPLIRSYSAVFSKERQQYHILIDDVTETHIEAAERMPTIEYGRALAQGLATIHAHWWGAKRIKSAGDSIPTASQINRFVAIAEPGVDPILEAFSASLKPHWPDLIRDFHANHPQAMINRTENENGFTLIHGDVNHRNLLVPKNGHQPLYIIDRQPFDWSLTTWLGVYDLAYALVLYWKPDLRRRYERQLLEIYHDQLILCGVRDYDWNQLFEDYRLSAAMGIYVATEWCRGGINERWIQVWLTMLQRSLEAVDDLNCELTWKGYAR